MEDVMTPDDILAEDSQSQQEPGFCEHCGHSPCHFLQWQEELERIVDIKYPEVTNKQKDYNMYSHITCRLHGPLGKDNRRPLPLCFGQGMRDLYPSKYYTGYKPSPLGDSK